MSVAVANDAEPRTPATIASVDIDDVLSTSLPCASSVVAITFAPPTVDDGVSTFVILNTYVVFCASPCAATVNTSVRLLTLYPTAAAIGLPMLPDATKATPGAFLVPDVSNDDDAAPSVKRHPYCAPGSDGITSSTLPPTSTRPAVRNVTVATDSNPGVSVAVANDADARLPAVIASVTTFVGPSIIFP